MRPNNYTNYSKPHVKEPELVEAVEVEEPIVEEVVKQKTGVVANCVRLNVRVAPAITADIKCEIKAGTEVVIDNDSSTEEFYKVSLATGVEGFCMKDYIEIR